MSLIYWIILLEQFSTENAHLSTRNSRRNKIFC